MRYYDIKKDVFRLFMSVELGKKMISSEEFGFQASILCHIYSSSYLFYLIWYKWYGINGDMLSLDDELTTQIGCSPQTLCNVFPQTELTFRTRSK